VNILETKFINGWYKLEPFQNYSGIKGITSDGKVLNETIPNQQAKQMDDDASSIMSGKPMHVPGEEGLKDIRVVEAVYKSVAQKQKVKIA
jgi:glucose-fructose oxidoreductase